MSHRDVVLDPVTARREAYAAMEHETQEAVFEALECLAAQGVVLGEKFTMVRDKRRALRRFVSQTTLYYPWQRKPVLSEALIDRFCKGPEIFLDIGAAPDAGAVFDVPRWGIAFAHRVEPRLKRLKESALTWLTRRGPRRSP